MTRPEIPGFNAERLASYLAGTAGAPAREQLVQAIALAHEVGGGAARRALDLGCGPGRETLALLRGGFSVVAIDPYPIMLQQTRALVEREAPTQTAQLTLIDATLEEFAESIEPASFDLIHAGFVLPFVNPTHFASAFARLRDGLSVGGIFAGQFFGPDDEFIKGAAINTMTAHDSNAVDQLLTGLEILHREEVKRSGQIGRGQAKWWHVHHVIVRKPA